MQWRAKIKHFLIVIRVHAKMCMFYKRSRRKAGDTMAYISPFAYSDSIQTELTRKEPSDYGKVNINEEKTENFKKLEAIALLPDDWNANGAKSFSENLITKMRSLLLLLEIQPEIFPTACASLQMEYDKVDGSHMEIELTEDESAEVFMVDHVGKESSKRVRAHAEDINRVVRDFYG